MANPSPSKTSSSVFCCLHYLHSPSTRPCLEGGHGTFVKVFQDAPRSLVCILQNLCECNLNIHALAVQSRYFNICPSFNLEALAFCRQNRTGVCVCSGTKGSHIQLKLSCCEFLARAYSALRIRYVIAYVSNLSDGTLFFYTACSPGSKSLGPRGRAG